MSQHHLAWQDGTELISSEHAQVGKHVLPPLLQDPVATPCPAHDTHIHTYTRKDSEPRTLRLSFEREGKEEKRKKKEMITTMRQRVESQQALRFFS